MTQKDLAERTGLRANAISEMVNNQRSTINREHAVIVANALEITDMNILCRLV
ncbi:helix-turn-helix domain-containing protein [Sporosarcina sp. FA15]|uniref:helix-turn-helix domain-containing protein n=1 Tax=Sporosarcina sp. FA15 TaxID=3413031 RepID=UPI003F65B68F